MATYFIGTQKDALIQMARANVERSERIIARAKTAMARRAAVRREAGIVHARCHRLGKERPTDSLVPPGIKTWLLAIASVIKDWHTMSKDEIDVNVAEATPAEAAAYIVGLHVPRDLRGEVLRALPKLTPYSFHYAAWQIRQAAFQHAG